MYICRGNGRVWVAARYLRAPRAFGEGEGEGVAIENATCKPSCNGYGGKLIETKARLQSFPGYAKCHACIYRCFEGFAYA